MPTMLKIALHTGAELVFRDVQEEVLCSVDDLLAEATESGEIPETMISIRQENGVNHYIAVRSIAHAVVVHGRVDPEELVAGRRAPGHGSQPATRRERIDRAQAPGARS